MHRCLFKLRAKAVRRSCSYPLRSMLPRGRNHRILKWAAVIALVLVFFVFAGIQIFRTYRENSHDKLILAAAQKYGVDPTLVKAVVWRESRFNPNARGGAGEIGL